jgi:hypothetical protein
MKLVRLTSTQRDTLLGLLESGMGYQWLEFSERPGVLRQGIAFNAELILAGEAGFTALSREVESLNLNKLASTTEAGWFGFRVVSPRGSQPAGRLHSLSVKEAASTAGPASDAQPELTAEGERFVRFSAYVDDHRITSDGRLLPGSYATTLLDAQNVETGTQAVQRYALPNSDPAIFWFDIDPKERVTIKRGTAQPANDQPGGGEEVIFVTGTKPGTVRRPPRELPPK